MHYGWNEIIEKPLEQGWVKDMIENKDRLGTYEIECLLVVFNTEFDRLNEKDEDEKLAFIKYFALEEYYKNNFEDEEFITFRNLFKNY